MPCPVFILLSGEPGEVVVAGEPAVVVATRTEPGIRAMVDTASCTPAWLSPRLEARTGDLLVLDCRSSNDFNASHIHGAMHLLLPAILLRRLRMGKLSVEQIIKKNEAEAGDFQGKWADKTLVLYDADGALDNVSSPTSTVSLLLHKMREDGYTAYLLAGGFTAFQEKYPPLCVGFETQEESTILGLRSLEITSGEELTSLPDEDSAAPFPVEVLPGLFLGNRQVAEDMEILDKHNIHYVVNVTADIPNHFENDSHFRYLQIPITDNIKENLASYFPKANAFIDEGRSAKAGVLVHCLAGISRSVTITVAYLMYHLHLTFNEAFSLVKRKKANISPNFNFLGQLLDYQEKLKCSCEPTCPSISSSLSSEESPPTNCSCTCHESKCFFTSPMVMTCTSTSSTCTSSSLEFDYDVPPTPS